MVRRNALRWYRWLRSVGMPTDHIAILLDLDPTEVDWLSHYRSRWRRPPKMPAECDARGSIYERPILNDTGLKIRKLDGLGYSPRRIAEILVIRPERVVDWLRRTTPTCTTPLVRPRTKDEQRRVDAERRRRERRRAKAAELADQVAEPAPAPEAPAPSAFEWDGPSDPRACSGERNGRAKVTWEMAREIRRLHAEGSSAYALARQFGLSGGTVRSIIRGETWRELDRSDGTAEPESPPVESPPAVAPAAPKPEVTIHEWRSSPDEPRMWARGSGSHYDDVTPTPPAETTPLPMGAPSISRDANCE